MAIISWDVIELLGKGSFGKVFLVKQDSTYFAVKTARIKRSNTLMKEEQILKHFIGCPEIIQCLGSELTRDSYSLKAIYNLKLEYAAGGSLADLIKEKKKLPEIEAKEYLKMILRGLSEIHRKGFVHADLKPHNILVFPQSDGNVKLKIADFGLSMRCGDNNKKNKEKWFEFKGTSVYMSPESITLPEFNTSLDIWSLGCTLIKMVSGKSVWRDCSDTKQFIRKLIIDMEVPKMPRKLSRKGRDFVQRCFDHDTTKRWTADMLLQHPYLKEEIELPRM